MSNKIRKMRKRRNNRIFLYYKYIPNLEQIVRSTLDNFSKAAHNLNSSINSINDSLCFATERIGEFNE